MRHQIAGVDYYDPKAAKFTSVDTCFGGGHTAFGNDKDETLYVTARGVNGLGWINTRVWDETHDAEKAQGWCPAVIDYNGDGEDGRVYEATRSSRSRNSIDTLPELPATSSRPIPLMEACGTDFPAASQEKSSAL